jgi:hypothetical protein
MTQNVDKMAETVLLTAPMYPLHGEISPNLVTLIGTPYLSQGCQIFLGTKYQNGEKYAKLPRTTLNCHKIGITKDRKMDQVSIKYTNIFLCKTLQKFTQIWIFG